MNLYFIHGAPQLRSIVKSIITDSNIFIPQITDIILSYAIWNSQCPRCGTQTCDTATTTAQQRHQHLCVQPMKKVCAKISIISDSSGSDSSGSGSTGGNVVSWRAQTIVLYGYNKFTLDGFKDQIRKSLMDFRPKTAAAAVACRVYLDDAEVTTDVQLRKILGDSGSSSGSDSGNQIFDVYYH